MPATGANQARRVTSDRNCSSLPGRNGARAHAPLRRRGRIPVSATPLQRMERKLKTKRGRVIYAKRAISIEPVFGQIKENRRARRFQRRGLLAVDCEWKLLAMTHNILKMWRVTAAIG